MDQLIDSLQYMNWGFCREFLGNGLEKLITITMSEDGLLYQQKLYCRYFSNYFGSGAGYDKTTSVVSTTSYTTPDTMANISGTVGKVKDGCRTKV